MRPLRSLLLALLGGLTVSAMPGGSLVADERSPFNALSDGRVQRTLCDPKGDRGVSWQIGTLGGHSTTVAADGRYTLRVPADELIRPVGQFACGVDGPTGSRPPASGEPVSVGANESLTADVHFPALAPPLFAFDVQSASGARTLNLARPGQTTSTVLRAESAAGEALAPEDIAGSGAVVFSASDVGVADVNGSGLVTARGEGLSWVRAVADGEWSQILVHVDANLDSDGDGLPDDWEVENGFDPLDPNDALADRDADGLTNLEEFLAGTDPADADTDGDLLSDSAEILLHGTDPLLADSDGDGYSDFSELNTGNDPLNINSNVDTDFEPIHRRSDSVTDAVAVASDSRDTLYVAGNGRFEAFRLNTLGFFLISQDSLTLTNDLRDLSVANNRAYVAAGADGIHVVDITSPPSLSSLGRLTGLGVVNAVLARGDRIYVASSTGFHIVEQQAPNFVVVGDVGVGGAANTVAVSGSLAYLGVPSSNTLAVVDFSEPSTPRLRSQFSMPASANRFEAIVATAHGVYVAHGSGGLVGVSVVDPDLPALLDSSSSDFPGSVFDAAALVGNVLAAHTPTLNSQAVLFTVAEDGRFDLAGDVTLTATGAKDLAFGQNYLLGLDTSILSISEVLYSGDRQAIPPSGSLRIRNPERRYAPGGRIQLAADAADDIYVERVAFAVDGVVVFEDSVPPFRYDVPIDLAVSTPSVIEFEATAVDLAGNSALLGRTTVEIEADLDGDLVPDSLDDDVDGDGIKDIEEVFPGVDGWVSDPRRADTDGDGISDGEEVTIGSDGFITDPSRRDTDGDGVSDAFEINVLLTRPDLFDTDGNGVADGDEDSDSDGLTHREEELAGTQPFLADSDSDGLLDGAEIELGLDPLDPDSDDDGVLDGQEDFDGDGLGNADEQVLGTDPQLADTDGDGLDDGVEVSINTDPTSPTDFSSENVVLTDRAVMLRDPLTVASLRLVRTVVLLGPGVTPATPLDITVLGELSVDVASQFRVDGRGHRGGRRNGNVSSLGERPGGEFSSGFETGGSHGGLGGVRSSIEEVSSPAYGSLGAPAESGSGGSAAATGAAMGGNGGGALRIRAGTLVLDGVLSANGLGAVGAGAGSGGSILVECGSLSGFGSMRANGGHVNGLGGAGAGGRIAVWVTSASTFSLDRVTARGGVGFDDAATGAPGTILWTQGGVTELVVENAGLAGEAAAMANIGLRGEIEEIGDDFIVAADDLPEYALGHWIDPDGEDGSFEAFRVLGLDGRRIDTEPGLLASGDVGDSFRGVLPATRIRVGTAATFVTDLDVATADVGTSLRIEFGAALTTGDLHIPEVTDLLLDDLTLSCERLYPSGGSLSSLSITDARLEVQRGSLDVGVTVIDGGVLSIGSSFSGVDLELRAAMVTVPSSTASEVFPLDMELTGTLLIDEDSTIDVSGKGYLGGGRPGNPSANGLAVGFQPVTAGGRTGGSHGGLGGHHAQGGEFGTHVGPTYDAFVFPQYPGGGGNARLSGGERGYNGGGLMRLTVDFLQLDGAILANGDGVDSSGPIETGGAGAGGGIYLEVGDLRGGGEIRANGGSSSPAVLSGCGGGGRIAIEYGARNLFTGTARAFGGTSAEGVAPHVVGGAGTVFWQLAGASTGELILDNGGRQQSRARSVLRPVGSGLITALTATTLRGNGPLFPTEDTRLEGQSVLVDSGNVTARILSNTSEELSTGGAALTDLGAVGDPYVGAIRLSRLVVTGNAWFSTSGDVIVIAPGGTVSVTGGGVVNAPPILFQ